MHVESSWLWAWHGEYGIMLGKQKNDVLGLIGLKGLSALNIQQCNLVLIHNSKTQLV